MSFNPIRAGLRLTADICEALVHLIDFSPAAEMLWYGTQSSSSDKPARPSGGDRPGAPLPARNVEPPGLPNLSDLLWKSARAADYWAAGMDCEHPEAYAELATQLRDAARAMK